MKCLLVSRTFMPVMVIDFVHKLASREWTYYSTTHTVTLCIGGVLAGMIQHYTCRHKLLQIARVALKIVGYGRLVNRNVGSQASIPHRNVALVISLLQLWTVGVGVSQATAVAVWSNRMPGNLTHYMPALVDSNQIEMFFNDITIKGIRLPIRQGAIKAHEATVFPLWAGALGLSFILLICACFQWNFYLSNAQNAYDQKDATGKVVEEKEGRHVKAEQWGRVSAFDDSSSSGSTASTATGSSGGSAGSNTGAGTTKAASTGAAGTGGSGGSSAGTGGGSTKTSADAGGESTGTATGSAAAASGTGGASSGSGGTGNIGGFWENWVGQSVADTDFSPYTHAYWFTAVPGTAEEKGALTMGEASDGQAKEWVTAAQSAGCKAMLTVGGWSGSSTFTKLVATDTSRSDFVDTLSTALDDYGFDGIDIDWEYPGAAGATNDFDSADLDNLLTFLKLLRDKIGTDKLISADTSASVWVGADGTASTDLSAFGEVLDWILIMEYDTVNGNSANTGPNFPYDSSCAPGGSTFATPTTTQAWIDAKFPAEKISIGLASYGYAWKVSDVVDGGGVSGASSTIYQTVSEKLDTDEQTVVWDDIGTTYASSTTTLDDCTSTPYLYSSDTQIFVAFDNEESIKKKGSFAGDNGLWGCGLYASLTQDKSGTLAKAAKEVC
ncbi:hypothetical protein JCM8547_005532 [Rhodosporidiobolus lusitaniae]